jgi:hypothetical protein
MRRSRHLRLLLEGEFCRHSVVLLLYRQDVSVELYIRNVSKAYPNGVQAVPLQYSVRLKMPPWIMN